MADVKQWITVHPNGADSKGQPIPVMEGQSKGEAVKSFVNKHKNEVKELNKKSTDELKKEVSKETPQERNTVANPSQKYTPTKSEKKTLLRQYMAENYGDDSEITWDGSYDVRYIKDDNFRNYVHNELKNIKSQKVKGSTVSAQYENAQNLYPDRVIVAKVGDFYQVIGDKAKEVGEALNLTVTERLSHSGERVPMVGFPEDRVKYLNQLGKKNKIAVLDEEGNVIPHRKNIKINNETHPVYSTMPEGYRKLQGAQTAPMGYEWIIKGSMFDKNKKLALIPESWMLED